MFRLGPLYVVQLSGFATGGPWSLVLLKLVLGWKEHGVDKKGWLKIADKYKLGKHRAKHLTAGRYADDLWNMSLDF